MSRHMQALAQGNLLMTKSYDRSAILRVAWSQAKWIASLIGRPVRQFIGAAMRKAWSIAKGVAAPAAPTMVPQPAQLQQADASNWTVVADHHAGSVLRHFVFEGLPVIVHTGARYPSLVNNAGVTTHDAMHIEIAIGYSDGAYVIARHGFKNGYSVQREVGRVSGTKAEQVERAMAFLAVAAASARTLRADKDLHDTQMVAVHEHVPSRRLTRPQYEAACALFGVDALPDDRATDKWDAGFPTRIETSRLALLTAFRRWQMDDEERQREADAEAAVERAWRDRLIELRGRPVARTETIVTVGSKPDEELRKGGTELWTVAKRGDTVEIDEDMPSRFGEHLLGYEGSRGRWTTYEIRTLA